MNEKNVNNQVENIVIHEPDIVKTKGRPGRYKAFWEKKNSKKQKAKGSTMRESPIGTGHRQNTRDKGIHLQKFNSSIINI